jgi:hypothetical protein
MMLYAFLKNPRIAILMMGIVWAGWGNAQFSSMGEIKDFRVPEFDANGVLKSEIYGDVAKPVSGDLIRITGLRIIMYKNQDVEATLTSEHCTVSRKDKNVFSNADVKIVRGNVVITGKGFRWSSETQRIEILNEFHMVMVGAVKMWPLVKEKN